jgi:redox-sensitive bicupin YhaK (pirin superfamily)
MTGFQIWVNVPSARKMDDPRYGTEPPENIPVLSIQSEEGVQIGHARVLAGEMNENIGPFRTVQDIQIVDYFLSSVSGSVASAVHSIPPLHDNCLVYVYKGSGSINESPVDTHSCIRFDASGSQRSFSISPSGEGLSVLVFSGKRLNQPVAWHGPFVMTTNDEIRQTIREYREGRFPPKRTKWDYKRIATKPK